MGQTADALHNAALLLMRKRRFSAALKLLDQFVTASQSNSGEVGAQGALGRDA